MSKIGKEIKKLSGEFQSWNNVLVSFMNAEYSAEDGKITSDCDYETLSTKLHNNLSVILSTFTKFGGTRDKFTSPQYELIMQGQGASIQSEKMNTKFCFGIYGNKFFLDSYIQYPWYIKSMDDNFWLNFLELGSLGEFEFQENAIPSTSVAKEILKNTGNSKSNIFNIIRNYILLENSGGSVDLGTLEIRWPINTPWEEILIKGSEAFKKIYRINYLLYRRYYINIRSRKYNL